MTEPVRILAVAGSLRQASLNKKLMMTGVEALRRRGAEVDVLDLNDVTMPLYSQDIEDSQGLPPGALEFKRRIALADGLLFGVPEYNSSIPGHFKNALDWASRGTEDVLRGKVGAIMSASPGAFGGIRMNTHLRQVMRALGVLAIYDQVTLPKAHEAFKEDGSLVSAHVQNLVETLAQSLVEECQMRKLWKQQLRLTLYPEDQLAVDQSKNP
jgi:NAD(P)H-dependent FMN reductase